jgi:hypothetical protein
MKNCFDIQNYDPTVQRLGPAIRTPMPTKAEQRAAEVLAFEKEKHDLRKFSDKNIWADVKRAAQWMRNGPCPSVVTFEDVKKASNALYRVVSRSTYYSGLRVHFGAASVRSLAVSQYAPFIAWAEAWAEHEIAHHEAQKHFDTTQWVPAKEDVREAVNAACMQGKREEVVKLLTAFNVRSASSLRIEQRAEFISRLRQL